MIFSVRDSIILKSSFQPFKIKDYNNSEIRR